MTWMEAVTEQDEYTTEVAGVDLEEGMVVRFTRAGRDPEDKEIRDIHHRSDDKCILVFDDAGVDTFEAHFHERFRILTGG